MSRFTPVVAGLLWRSLPRALRSRRWPQNPVRWWTSHHFQEEKLQWRRSQQAVRCARGESQIPLRSIQHSFGLDLASRYLPGPGKCCWSGYPARTLAPKTWSKPEPQLLKRSRLKNFPDHYNFSKKDILKLKEDSEKLKAILLTTEKDYMRLSDDNKKHIDYLEIELIIDKKDKFINEIKKIHETF